ncbi:MAG: hypothetical protein KDI33_04735, partial [Halioglobus sp.]|nr:hypothetical protein [Halioglobus sp.]
MLPPLRLRPTRAFLLLLASVFTASVLAQAPEPTPKERAAMLKEWMAASEAQLRHYQWMSETVITVDGDEKSDDKDRCFYGPEGMVQKVSLGDSVKSGGGLPGILPPGRLIKMIEEHKQEEMKAYINNAITLLQTYLTPKSTDIHADVAAGLLSVNLLEPGKREELIFTD